MKVRIPSLRRPKYVFAAVLMGASSLLPSVLIQPAYAAQLEDRQIKMSTSVAGATASYQISFTSASSYTLEGIVVDFCKGSPIIGDTTCVNPGTFAVGTTPTFTATGGDNTLGAGWTSGSLNSQRTLTMTNATGTAVTNAAPVTFTVTGITNPTPSVPTDQTFYARVYAYTDSALPASYTLADPQAYEDAGGVALSTSSAVSVSGTVQETLVFCTSDATITACSSTTAPTIVLGTGTPKVLDASNVYTDSIHSYITTNAGSGAIVRMRNSNNCGGLSKDGGTNCEIAAVGVSSGLTESPISSGALFGMRAAITSGTGLTVANPYDDAVNFGMDANTANDNVTTTYGDTVASSNGVLDAVKTEYTFGARAANTTPAGQYTANMVLIATGTY